MALPVLGLTPNLCYIGQWEMENYVRCFFHLAVLPSLTAAQATHLSCSRAVCVVADIFHSLSFPGCIHSRYRKKTHQLTGTTATLWRWGQFLPTASKCRATKSLVTKATPCAPCREKLFLHYIVNLCSKLIRAVVRTYTCSEHSTSLWQRVNNSPGALVSAHGWVWPAQADRVGRRCWHHPSSMWPLLSGDDAETVLRLLSAQSSINP